MTKKKNYLCWTIIFVENGHASVLMSGKVFNFCKKKVNRFHNLYAISSVRQLSPVIASGKHWNFG